VPGGEAAAGSWTNWSGTTHCRPHRFASPRSEAEIVEAVRAAAASGHSVRVAGSGHSHPPLVATEGLLLSLAGWSGIESHDTTAQQATVRAGTVLHDLGASLHPLGLAMENLGDVDVQALAGALGTGTHGTGRELGNLCTRVVELRLVDAEGETVSCSATERSDLFAAARLGLGALGVMTQATLQLLPAYRLHERVWREDVEPLMEELGELIVNHRHFEFFWLPSRDRAECKTLDPTQAAPDPAPGPPRERIDHSHRILPSVREDRFVEMEYSVPAERGPEAFLELRRLMQTRFDDVVWPVEYRSLARDDVWLSPAFGRPTVTLSVHQGAGLPFERFFREAELILRNHEGRPHWGKWHSLRAAELAPLYPRWDDFQAARRRADPAGRFLNPYLKELFGEASGVAR